MKRPYIIKEPLAVVVIMTFAAIVLFSILFYPMTIDVVETQFPKFKAVFVDDGNKQEIYFDSYVISDGKYIFSFKNEFVAEVYPTNKTYLSIQKNTIK